MKYPTRRIYKNVKITAIASLAAAVIAFAGLNIFSADQTTSDLGAPGGVLPGTGLPVDLVFAAARAVIR